MKHKILSLLVLLLTAATGAWAQADVTWTFAQVHDVVGDEITADETYTSDGISMKFVKNDDMHSCTFTASTISISGGGGCLQFTAPDGKQFSKIVLNSSATGNDQSFCSWNPGYVDGVYSTTWEGDEPAAVVTTSPVGSGWDFYLYSPTTFEFYFAGSGVEVTFNEANTEATFAMPAFDATATYELVRDMEVKVSAKVGDGTDGVGIRIQKVDNEFRPVDPMQLIPIVSDILDAQNPKVMELGKQYNMKGMQVQDASDPTVWTDTEEFGVGIYRIVIEGIGDYDGIIYTNEFQLYEQMNITFSKGYSTHYYANPLKLAEANDGLKIYAVTAVSTEKVTLTEIESKAIPTKTPFIAYNSTAEALTVAFNLQSGDAVSTATQFKGSATEKTMDAQSGCYVLRNGDSTPTFRLVEGRGTLPAHRCWIELGSNASTRSLGFDFGDGTTGIKTIGQSDDIQSDDYYDLQGRKREGTPQRKGTYIHNGKTIIIK